ncbi:hypothetical protein [Chryseobacterium sp. CH1]|nr:hypothetical protein [Chryseobacterium sp. CH1]
MKILEEANYPESKLTIIAKEHDEYAIDKQAVSELKKGKTWEL